MPQCKQRKGIYSKLYQKDILHGIASSGDRPDVRSRMDRYRDIIIRAETVQLPRDLLKEIVTRTFDKPSER